MQEVASRNSEVGPEYEKEALSIDTTPGPSQLPKHDQNIASTIESLSTRDERIYLATISVSMFVTGWIIGSTGPLLPTMQTYYHVNYTIVSMIFISSTCGTFPGSIVSGWLTDKFGFGKMYTAGAVIQLVAFAVMSIPPPFPVLCVMYAVFGLAGAFQMASCNIFLAGMPNTSTNLGIAHAIFGVGALCSPLVATQFAQLPTRWAFHYLTCLGLSVINLVLTVVIFKFKRQEALLPAQHAAEENVGREKLWETLKLPVLHFMQLFIFVYVGVEVSGGGWIVTFLEVHRGGKTSTTGYVSSGFWGGLAVGRLALLPITRFLGDDRAIFVYIIVSMGFVFTIWFVPSLIENAVAISMVGFMIGPFYPLVVKAASRKIPKRLVAGSIGIISAAGQVGAAAFPFATGALAGRFGVISMQPLTIAMLAAMIVLWVGVLWSSRQVNTNAV